MSELTVTRREMLAIASARCIKDGDVAFIGFGLPMIAALQARNYNAKNSILIAESGVYSPAPAELPNAMGDARWMFGSPISVDAGPVMMMILQNKKIDTAFLGGAQVDRYGNLNSTCIGDYLNPIRRLPGSGGASDIAAMAKSTIILIDHDKRHFVEKVDYLTTPGWKCKYNGTDEMRTREEMGMWGGPKKVISNLGIMEFDEVTHEMYCTQYYENLGVKPQDIIDNTGFQIDVSKAVPFELPTEEELEVLRRIDKDKVFIG
jgi:glutaconate CoA-transferase subunit B